MQTAVPTREQLVQRATDLLPLLRRNAQWAEEHRRLPDETIEALADAGFFKLRTPLRYGGYECDTRTLVEVAAELGRGDGASSWTTSVYWIPTWMACQFPDEVQDEVFATPDVRICGTLSPSAMASPTAGGIVVDGKWGFVSGALHSHWQEIIAVLVDGDNEPMPVMALVPMSDLRVVDDWHTSGLRGTGSVSTVAEQVFVPAARVLPLGMVLQGGSASQRNAESVIYRPPLLPVAAASSVGTMLGLARAGQDIFLERLPERKITYTDYAHQADAPLTHLQLADATVRADEAEFHALRLADLVDTKAADGSDWTLLERARARAGVGAACRRARESVEILAGASGGTSIYSSVPMRRVLHDAQSVNLHALMNPDTNAELYGRVLAGLAPNTLYL
ncbi:acyl-CoA dehydrogenase family protein [Solwaraspora sp. WMMD791]|uniref:acyl-CoA dehydrogenase family protein n=1 Tax=Solwaraspora sp. WMMD791 TaxID=3016086 RepID=UPI00249A9275|nr:acyl-CoA dehydrogenase family protein [Solwaraspora sp. WMMD791]WFE30494.1 acyl-CoA dehydrogenase family protein [Solwaraspora sp. WMMD791]